MNFESCIFCSENLEKLFLLQTKSLKFGLNECMIQLPNFKYQQEGYGKLNIISYIKKYFLKWK